MLSDFADASGCSDLAESDIKEMAAAIFRRGMTIPAIFFLEAHKPLTAIVNFGANLCAPVLVPLFGSQRIENIHRLLENPELVEKLIVELESLRESGIK